MFLNNTVLVHINYINLKKEEKSSKNICTVFFSCNTNYMMLYIIPRI